VAKIANIQPAGESMESDGFGVWPFFLMFFAVFFFLIIIIIIICCRRPEHEHPPCDPPRGERQR